MSYWVYLEEPRCEHCKRDGNTVFERNMTSNISSIWYRALLVALGKPFYPKDSTNFDDSLWEDEPPPSEKYGSYGAFGPLRGKSGEEGAKLCLAAAGHIRANMNLYTSFNAENGWGNASNALDFMQALGSAWLEHPTATLRVSR